LVVQDARVHEPQTGMYDPPLGRVADVERLLQVLALLRASEVGVLRSTLVEKVGADAADAAAAPAEGPTHDNAVEALKRKMWLNINRLRSLGFSIESDAPEGMESRFFLRPTPWRVPVDLDEQEQALLSWVMRRSAPVVDETAFAPLSSSYDSLLGTLPHGLGLVHAALAGRRSLVIEVDGQEKVVEPVQLASYQGRWSLLVRFPGSDQVYGYRLDRLEVVRLDDVLPAAPEKVDPLTVLDPTGWKKHDPLPVEIQCDARDLPLVRSWFPRAATGMTASEAALTFSSTNCEAVIDRVLGLAGAARLVAPDSAVAGLRQRLQWFVEEEA
jgi:hypothetical protein